MNTYHKLIEAIGQTAAYTYAPNLARQRRETDPGAAPNQNGEENHERHH